MLDSKFLLNFLFNLDYILLTSPAPSIGPALKFILELMKTFNVKLEDFQTSTFYSNILKVGVTIFIMFF